MRELPHAAANCLYPRTSLMGEESSVGASFNIKCVGLMGMNSQQSLNPPLPLSILKPHVCTHVVDGSAEYVKVHCAPKKGQWCPR